MFDGMISKEMSEVGWALSVDGGRLNPKESRQVERMRQEEKGWTAVKKGRLCEEGYLRRGGGCRVERNSW